jgi:hypothetical protein
LDIGKVVELGGVRLRVANLEIELVQENNKKGATAYAGVSLKWNFFRERKAEIWKGGNKDRHPH